uniref:Uncharacterized protein n=1 Tax=Oryza brachyantha TaxID=4533 RepID=J3LME4_ORYBR
MAAAADRIARYRATTAEIGQRQRSSGNGNEARADTKDLGRWLDSATRSSSNLDLGARCGFDGRRRGWSSMRLREGGGELCARVEACRGGAPISIAWFPVVPLWYSLSSSGALEKTRVASSNYSPCALSSPRWLIAGVARNGDRQADDAAKAPAPCGGGWRHPALPTPVAEPASLLPFFQSQCALEVHNAQQ